MQKQYKNVLVLFCTQSTLQITTVTLIAVTGLAGFALAENKSFATLPLTTYVFGAAFTTIPASLLMARIGRRAGFQVGTLFGVIGGGLCAWSIYMGSFAMLCASTFVMGMYTAFGKYYRLAAADVASPDFKAKAISFTLAGGILGGVLGPEVAKFSRALIDNHVFMGSYMAIAVVACMAMLILSRLDIPRLTVEERSGPTRPLRQIMRQPNFIVAALAGMMSYGIMNLMMTSTPLAMRAHDHQFNDSVHVIEWHVIGMYAPSFFTGSLISRFGVLQIILLGVLLNIFAIGSGLLGTGFTHFWWAMFLNGVGWNFMYIGASALLTECHTPAERAKTQATNDFMIFATMAVSSMSSGVLLQKSGWHAVNWGALPFILMAGFAVFWLMSRRRDTVSA